MEESIQPFGDVLANIASVPWTLALYLDPQRPWTETTRCAVLDPDDVDDPDGDEVPPYAAANGLVDALLVTQAQDIVSNAKQQRPDATIADLVRAFNYYFDNDAFITL